MAFKIIDKGWKKHIYDLRKAKQSYSKVGFPTEGKIRLGTRKGSGHDYVQSMLELAQIAAVHEFGAPSKNISARPFVRITYDRWLPVLEKMAYEELRKITIGESTVRKSLGRMGEFLVGKMKEQIRDGEYVPLSPKTIAKKRSSKPLIDTAQMIQSVTHVENIV